jgi:hypothetical protein
MRSPSHQGRRCSTTSSRRYITFGNIRSSSPSGLRVLLHRLVDDLPLPPLLRRSARVPPSRLIRELALEPLVARPALGVELTRFDRSAHRTAGLFAVVTVSISAALRERPDLVERRRQRLVARPGLELAEPGASTSSAPPGRSSSFRSVVVCRPVSSSARMGAVRCSARPASALTSVDLPTPEDPRSASVRPGDSSAASSPSSPSPVYVLIAWIDTPGAEARHRSSRASRVSPSSPSKSHLLSTTTGSTPPFVRHHEISLDASRAEVTVDRHDDEERIDVRREDLLLGGATR